MNIAILQGNIARDPEMKYTQNGKAVVSLSIAVKDYGDKVYFINCTAWEKTAEFIGNYFRKGQQILINGKLTVRDYEKDGQKRYITEVVIEKAFFCGKKEAEQMDGFTPSSEPTPF